MPFRYDVLWKPCMSESEKPVVLLDPAPRHCSEIFTKQNLAILHEHYSVRERGDADAKPFYEAHLPEAMFVLGQPDLSAQMIGSARNLRAIINVEGNFLQNMDYEACFRNKIHVLVISPVFAQAVAELSLGLTLALARDICKAHNDFASSQELYGLASNANAQLLSASSLGFIGFGDLGRAILRVFSGFNCKVRIYDPWLSPQALQREGLQSASLDEILSESDIIQVVASVTPESTHLIGRREFALMKQGAMLVLLSRADVCDFDALQVACASGRIRAASDVFPTEPLHKDSVLRQTPNLLLSAHRAGALKSALFEIGDRVLADLDLMTRSLPPQNCKRAEHELVGRMRSRPVQMS